MQQLQRCTAFPSTSGVAPQLRPSTLPRYAWRFSRAAAARGPAASLEQPTVVVTREKGKNWKLMQELNQQGLQCLELPLIEHADGPDRLRLAQVLQSEQFDWVAVTSPEAASVLLEAWRQAGQPQLRVAVVGGGTAEALKEGGIQPQFTASKALGKTMGAELPRLPPPAGTGRVLYPASCRASSDLQDSLQAAGFSVTRLNTYDTVAVGLEGVDAELLDAARAADVVTFGSPSTVKAWVALVGLEAAQRPFSACIGSTSARACASVGIQKDRVLYPEAPGLDGWVGVVLQALGREGQAPPAGQGAAA